MNKERREPIDKESVEEQVSDAMKNTKPANKETYDERFEGYFEVTVGVINLRSIPNGKKGDSIVKALMRGTKVKCDGHFTVIDGKRFFKVTSEGDTGYICETNVTKL